jgi:hypothetical protein
MSNPGIYTKLPLHSVDSIGVLLTARYDKGWAVKSSGAKFVPSALQMRISLLRHRLESFQSPTRCDFDKLKHTVDPESFNPDGAFNDLLVEDEAVLQEI